MSTPQRSSTRMRPGMEPPNKGGKYPAEPLSPEEVAAILAQTSSDYPTPVRNKALIMLLYRSGLRVSEILGLRASDVDFAHHSIRLRDTKSQKAQTRGFHPTADPALTRWIERRKNLGLAVNGHPLFCKLDGGPVSDDYVRKMLNRLARKAGVEKRVHPHGLRHTFATELEQAGTPLTVISRLLGHGSVATTDKYLQSLTNSEAVEALQDLQLPGDFTTRATAEAIRILYAFGIDKPGHSRHTAVCGHWSTARLARAFGVSEHTVARILQRRAWGPEFGQPTAEEQEQARQIVDHMLATHPPDEDD